MFEEDTGTLLTVVVIYAGIVTVAFWLTMIIWTYRDMRARSRDGLAQLFVVVVVATLTLPGLLIYLFLRPRETLSEAYERSLEEEALLQEIEEKPSCPGCGQRVQTEWQACPNCHTRLKKPCVVCRRLLELSWNLCPHCAASQTGYASANTGSETDYNRSHPMPTSESRISLTRKDPEPQTGYNTDPLEFVDGDEYGV
jgi:RNA polymerase subunit RPABC4/transcription elongation factor Spt4